MDSSANAEAGPSTGSHRMRISSGGNVQAYVKFALSFFQEHPHRPLVLHTIPPDSPSSSTSQSTLHPATLTAPRLISVVELIKRTYIEHQRKVGKSSARGIWQYTETGLLPTAVLAEEEGAELVRVLGGKTKPKMIHRPYLKITLSTIPLELDKERNVTCQYILTRRRNRGKRGTAMEEEGGVANAAGDGAEKDKDKDTVSTYAGALQQTRTEGTPRQIAATDKKGEKRKSTASQDGGGTRKKNKS